MKIRFFDVRNLCVKITKFGFYIPFSNLLLAYGSGWLPDSMLSAVCENRNKKIQKKLSHIISCVNYETPQIALPSVKVDNAIWTCWFQGEKSVPAIVELCLKSMRRYANGHKVVVLTKENYSQYVTIPRAIENLYETGKLKPAHFADIIRINLLAQQGGLWLDATMLVVQPISQEVFVSPLFTVKTNPEGYFVSRCRWTVFVMGTARGSLLFAKLARAFEIYLSETYSFVDYFMFDQFIDLLYKTDPEVRKIIDEVPYNNQNIHKLNALMCRKFNEAEFAEICQNTSFFKLNWRSCSSDALASGDDTYYKHLKRIFQDDISSHPSL